MFTKTLQKLHKNYIIITLIIYKIYKNTCCTHFFALPVVFQSIRILPPHFTIGVKPSLFSSDICGMKL